MQPQQQQQGDPPDLAATSADEEVNVLISAALPTASTSPQLQLRPQYQLQQLPAFTNLTTSPESPPDSQNRW